VTGLPAIELRELRADDLEAAYTLDQACFEPGIAYSRAEIRSFVARPGAIALAAQAGGELVGFAIAERRGRRGHIVTIDIASLARRRGLGRRLFAELLRRLEAAGARQIRLEVDVRNAGAIRFYEGLGFERTRTLRGYYGRGLDGYEMIRKDAGEGLPGA
jgi:ribosomal-protein-alanine N-acetyltransferase